MGAVGPISARAVGPGMPSTASESERRWAERWRRRWDRQQERYLPTRDERFDAILDALDRAVASPPGTVASRKSRPFRFVDLGCGTGALSERILNRFPRAVGVGVDFDPVLMKIGRVALGSVGGRFRWVDADLRRTGWVASLPHGRMDAAVSTTALHWLTAFELRRLYGALARRLRPGGVFVNGDHMEYPSSARRLKRWARANRGIDRAVFSGPGESWRAWWTAVLADPRVAAEAASRAKRVPRHHEDVPPVDLRAHTRMLRGAGFREVGTTWSRWENRVLVAVR